MDTITKQRRRQDEEKTRERPIGQSVMEGRFILLLEGKAPTNENGGEDIYGIDQSNKGGIVISSDIINLDSATCY